MNNEASNDGFAKCEQGCDAQTQTMDYQVHPHGCQSHIFGSNLALNKTSWSHLIKNVRQIENPIESLCALVENSVQAGSHKVQVSLRLLESAEKLSAPVQSPQPNSP